MEEATIGDGQRKEPDQDGHGGLGDGLYRLGKGREILGRLFSFAGGGHGGHGGGKGGGTRRALRGWSWQ